jgi:hypothetical protein
VVFIGPGELGLPDNAIVAFALGCDPVNVACEAMLALGCIQTQECHTDRCPTGVAHPGLIVADDVEILDGHRSSVPLREVYGYQPGWGLPSAADQAAIPTLMEGSLQGRAPASSSTGT